MGAAWSVVVANLQRGRRIGNVDDAQAAWSGGDIGDVACHCQALHDSREDTCSADHNRMRRIGDGQDDQARTDAHVGQRAADGERVAHAADVAGKLHIQGVAQRHARPGLSERRAAGASHGDGDGANRTASLSMPLGGAALPRTTAAGSIIERSKERTMSRLATVTERVLDMDGLLGRT